LFFKPKEISEKTGITTRQLADMAEKEIVHPVIKAAGYGSSRYYDTKGLFAIFLAASVRRLLPIGEQRTLVSKAVDNEAAEKKRFCFLDRDITGLIAVSFSDDSIVDGFGEKWFSRTIFDLSLIRKKIDEF